MDKLFVLVLIVLSINVFADSEMESISAMAAETPSLGDIKMNKGDIKKSLEMMKSSGKINNADYLKALKELEAMDDKKMDDLQKQATEMVLKDPAAAQKMLDKPLK